MFTKANDGLTLCLQRLRLGIDRQRCRFGNGGEARRNTVVGVLMRSHGCHAYTVHALQANEYGHDR
jgi:hypothetical protein